VDESKAAESGGLRTAAILIVGDEILSGEVADENAAYIARRLTALGLRVEEIRVVPDRMAAIVAALEEARAGHDLVFVTGGIGPTHDDMTRQAVAEVLAVECARHPEAESRLRTGYGQVITESELTMADLPRGSHLLLGTRTGAFGFGVGPYHVLPGIPALLRDILDHMTAEWEPAAYFRDEIVTRLREGHLADGLRAIQDAVPAVAIGSYPVKTADGYRVRIVLRARDEASLARVRDQVSALIAAAEDGTASPGA